MTLDETIHTAIINRASELALAQFVREGQRSEVDLTKAVEQASNEVKQAADDYFKLMRLLVVKMTGKEKTPESPVQEPLT